jgi:hypothetical protein
MNIFVLDIDIKNCARYHCDRHVAKMLLEGVQILCTVCDKFGIKAPYRATHYKHPCVLWAGESIQNWHWLKKLVTALNEEYKYRYRKRVDHKSFTIVTRLLEPNLPNLGLTEFCQVMPQEFRILGDPVRAYRDYYIYSKKTIAKWTRRRDPRWFKRCAKLTTNRKLNVKNGCH